MESEKERERERARERERTWKRERERAVVVLFVCRRPLRLVLAKFGGRKSAQTLAAR